MKAARKTADGRFEIAEVDDPQLPRADWVKARVRMAGICGTDLRHWQKAEEELHCCIMGYELAGEVVEVGADVTRVAVGDRVLVESVLGCGQCEWCRVQQYNRCPDLYPTRRASISRAYAELAAGPRDKFHKPPQAIGHDDAALLDTYAVALHAQHLSDLTIDARVAIIGAVPHALDLARRLGADRAIHSAEEDPVAAIRAMTGDRGADIVFECAGGESMPDTLPLATRLVRRGGKVVIVGGFDAGETTIPLEWQRIQMSEITLIPSASFAFRDLYSEQPTVLDLLVRGKLRTQELITHRFPLERINEAFETAQDRRRTLAIFVGLEI